MNPRALFRSLIPLLISLNSFLIGYDYNISVCCIFKDNAPYLKEWIEYHRMIGVDHFYLYDNSSTDNPRTVLDYLIEQNIVTLIDWPNQNQDQWGSQKHAWVWTTQLTAYNHAINLTENKTKWLAIIDTDEFITPVLHSDLCAFLDKHENDPGIFIHWQVYGTSGVYDVPPNKLMIELLTLKCLPNQYINKYTKMIIKPELFKKWHMPVPHRCRFKNKLKPYKPHYDEIRINHYINRTIKFFYEQKINAKITMDNTALWSDDRILEILNLGNDIEDRIMDKYIPALRQRMGFGE